MRPTIAFLNVSTVVSAAELTAAVAALQTQVTRDFAPHYGVDAFLTIITADGLMPDAWQIIISDDSDQAGALGYHELTQFGQPLGKVFAGSDKKDGLCWTITASHELLEMLGDPWACLCAYGTDQKIRAYEVCDAVEDDSLGYTIDGGFGKVWVSDFVLPSWFDSSTGPYDFRNRVHKPLELLPGGYIGMVDPTGAWTQVMADTEKKGRMVIKDGSRRYRRSIPRAEWRESV